MLRVNAANLSRTGKTCVSADARKHTHTGQMCCPKKMKEEARREKTVALMELGEEKRRIWA